MWTTRQAAISAIIFSAWLWALIPISQAGSTERGDTEVEIGETFELHAGEVVRLRGTPVHLRIERFIKPRCVRQPCPQGRVLYVMEAGGVAFPPGQPYVVETLSTDYEDSARLKVLHEAERCRQYEDRRADGCWRNHARKYGNVSYCERIKDQQTKDTCFELMASYLNQPKLCGRVDVPRSFCRYLEAVTQKRIEVCASVLSYEHRVSCYQELAGVSQAAADSCASLPESQRNMCTEALEASP